MIKELCKERDQGPCLDRKVAVPFIETFIQSRELLLESASIKSRPAKRPRKEQQQPHLAKITVGADATIADQWKQASLMQSTAQAPGSQETANVSGVSHALADTADVVMEGNASQQTGLTAVAEQQADVVAGGDAEEMDLWGSDEECEEPRHLEIDFAQIEQQNSQIEIVLSQQVDAGYDMKPTMPCIHALQTRHGLQLRQTAGPKGQQLLTIELPTSGELRLGRAKVPSFALTID